MFNIKFGYLLKFFQIKSKAIGNYINNKVKILELPKFDKYSIID